MATWQKVKTQLDALIDWYEKHKPDAGRKLSVPCTRSELWKIGGLSTLPDGGYPPEIRYRGRIIVADLP